MNLESLQGREGVERKFEIYVGGLSFFVTKEVLHNYLNENVSNKDVTIADVEIIHKDSQNKSSPQSAEKDIVILNGSVMCAKIQALCRCVTDENDEETRIKEMEEIAIEALTNKRFMGRLLG